MGVAGIRVRGAGEGVEAAGVAVLDIARSGPASPVAAAVTVAGSAPLPEPLLEPEPCTTTTISRSAQVGDCPETTSGSDHSHETNESLIAAFRTADPDCADTAVREHLAGCEHFALALLNLD
jgi:hypothetical protein